MKTLLIPMLALAAALPVAAQSSDLSTWTRYGDVSAVATGATLTTAAVESGETPGSAQSALIYYELESALGVSFDADTYEGSALGTSFAALAGTQVTVNWTLSADDFDAGFADRAYVIVDGNVQTLAVTQGLAFGGTFSHTFSTGGTHSLTFAVLDVNDFIAVSRLTLSDVTVTAVPEPGTYALLLAGLGLVGAVARRRRG